MDTIVELSHHTPHLFLYVTDTMERDEQTDLFEQAVEKIYFPKNPGNASEIARAIQQDGIDILIDLDSLTTPNNVRILYQRPAAICISWMGFDAPFISSDGYLLGDAHTRPPGIETHYVEKILRMPDALVAVSGFDCEPISREERREALGIETHEFAYLSVARGTKFTAEMVRAQIAILQQVPDSVLIYKQVGEVAVIDEAYRRECEIQQVDFRRLRGVGVETPEERHRTIYRAADLLLDSYPMNGGTYSLEALWLELPMVTLVGEQYCSRMGYSFLKTLGIEVGLAGSWEEYVGWGIRLGRDTALRQSIRERLLAAKSPESLSPLWNPNKFARDLYYILQELLAQ